MSNTADTLIRAYNQLLNEDNNLAAAREIHAFIRRRFPQESVLNKLRQVRRREPSPKPVPTGLVEIVPQFKKKTLTHKREEVAVGEPKATSIDDLTIDQIIGIINEGEEAMIITFGSVDAFRDYTLDRFEGLDYGRKTAFSSVSTAFLEYIEEEMPEEIEEVAVIGADEDIFD